MSWKVTSRLPFGVPAATGGVIAGGLLLAAPAAASGGPVAPLGFLGIPSIHSIVEGIVNFFFNALAKALVPDFLKEASVATIKWLVAVPDPSTWTHVAQLEGDMTYLAVSLLGVSFTAATVRYLLVGLTGTGHPMQALGSTLGSAGALVIYPWATHQLVAMVNTLTNAILSYPVVGEGLQRTVGLMFGSALLVGSGGVFVAVLVIVGIVFATVMFAMKVLVLLAYALLYVVGVLVIAVRPLPELSHLTRAWGTAILGVSMIPIGWAILFAVAGALSLDATTLGAVGHTGLVGGLTSHIAGLFAALLTFWLALKLPLGVIGHLRGALGGTVGQSPPPGGIGGGGGSRSLSGPARLSAANARLRAGVLQAGGIAGSAAGALGAPRGGAVGAGMRAGGRRAAPLAAAASLAGGVAAWDARGVAQRLSGTKAGRRLTASRTAKAATGRLRAAGLVLAGAPRQIRDATRPSAKKGSPASTGRGQRSPQPGRTPSTPRQPRGREKRSQAKSTTRPKTPRGGAPRTGQGTGRPQQGAPRHPPGNPRVGGGNGPGKGGPVAGPPSNPRPVGRAGRARKPGSVSDPGRAGQSRNPVSRKSPPRKVPHRGPGNHRKKG
jgi:hypothetical protein